MSYFVLKVALTVLTGVIAFGVVRHEWLGEREKRPFKQRKNPRPKRYTLALAGVIITTVLSILTDWHEQQDRVSSDRETARRDSLIKHGLDSSLASLSWLANDLSIARTTIDSTRIEAVLGINEASIELNRVRRGLHQGFDSSLRSLARHDISLDQANKELMKTNYLMREQAFSIRRGVLHYMVAYAAPPVLRRRMEGRSRYPQDCDFGFPVLSPWSADSVTVKDIYAAGVPSLPRGLMARIHFHWPGADKSMVTRIGEFEAWPIDTNEARVRYRYSCDTLFAYYEVAITNSANAFVLSDFKPSLWDLDKKDLHVILGFPDWEGQKGILVSDFLLDFGHSSIRVNPFWMCNRDEDGLQKADIRISSMVDRSAAMGGKRAEAHYYSAPFRKYCRCASQCF